MFVSVSVCRYKGFNLNYISNDVVDLVEYRVDTPPQFQYIVDKIGNKLKFGGWLSVNMNL